MGYLVGLLAIIALALVLSGSSDCSCRGESAGSTAVVKSVGRIKVLDRQAIRNLLKRLSASPPPTLRMGAMCYDMTGPPARAEYVCPTCGERSVYEQGLAEAVGWGIPACRREFKELEKVADGAVKLDESQFCRKCSGEIQEPKLVLSIQIEEGKAQVTSGVTRQDLRLLREFLAGELVDVGDTGDESPLRDKLPRLKTLLGIEPD